MLISMQANVWDSHKLSVQEGGGLSLPDDNEPVFDAARFAAIDYFPDMGTSNTLPREFGFSLEDGTEIEGKPDDKYLFDARDIPASGRILSGLPHRIQKN